ncbi:uncharacterized protein K452DRAFT_358074 [Aplosporella prunicola CBS 121167]|uniref:Uncharacterized protein n=1 Tax=Aplosporella prunicola CBS 121167 TaxID=1176127 RepID=A0A6A6BJQ0_9PEZI|nr:uncharacterized protein K452DRAFT_358074 [Aplosporella prunicola CBS 121167]KAF2143047.1 hypothetical protein K452DRAFT_358074 [Aplosporella prunicola CBS 121167]
MGTLLVVFACMLEQRLPRAPPSFGTPHPSSTRVRTSPSKQATPSPLASSASKPVPRRPLPSPARSRLAKSHAHRPTTMPIPSCPLSLSRGSLSTLFVFCHCRRRRRRLPCTSVLTAKQPARAHTRNRHVLAPTPPLAAAPSRRRDVSEARAHPAAAPVTARGVNGTRIGRALTDDLRAAAPSLSVSSFSLPARAILARLRLISLPCLRLVSVTGDGSLCGGACLCPSVWPPAPAPAPAPVPVPANQPARLPAPAKRPRPRPRLRLRACCPTYLRPKAPTYLPACLPHRLAARCTSARLALPNSTNSTRDRAPPMEPASRAPPSPSPSPLPATGAGDKSASAVAEGGGKAVGGVRPPPHPPPARLSAHLVHAAVAAVVAARLDFVVHACVACVQSGCLVPARARAPAAAAAAAAAHGARTSAGPD